MGNQTSTPITLIGFLKVIELDSIGYCGGLLIVSPSGRPIEFHCTAPVARNRAQEIMYGQTYQSFLFTEQIGLALLEKSQSQAEVLVIDSQPLASIKSLVETPIVWVKEISEKQKAEASSTNSLGWTSLDVSGESLFANNANTQQSAQLKRTVSGFLRTLPLQEPFERISIAIEEANQVLRAA